jgi:hypothetical protein
MGTNTKRKTEVYPENTTLRAALEDGGIDYRSGAVNLDGEPLAPGDFDKTFADFGKTGKCFLLKVAKADNAA